MDRYLMNPATGSVDVEDNWMAEMFTWDDDPAECQRQFNSLIEVIQEAGGNWIAANAVVALMDDDIREQLHLRGDLESEQAFADAYAREHLIKFGEEFRVN